MFPPRASTGGGGSSAPLDQAPPSPQSMGGGPTGTPTPFSLAAVAPGISSAQMPPEILTAILTSSQKIASMFDAYAQATPDLAADWAMLKDQLQAVLAKLTMSGATAMSPTATGQQFPGGGVDRGVAGAGMV